jgi:hypothetical protein
MITNFGNNQLLICLLLATLMGSCTNSSENDMLSSSDNQLTDEEKNKGWILMFDGKTSYGWRGYLMDTFPEGWTVENGTLMSLGRGDDTGGDIIYDKQFSNFELSLDWKISRKGNSGIFYHIQENEKFKSTYFTGPEYQLIDDVRFPQRLVAWQQTGADYAMHPADPDRKQLNPAGQWNNATILFNQGHVEHWLNGKKIVEFEAWTDDWYKKVNKGKWKDYKSYGLAKTGYIGLQDHGSRIWFKNIKIREL